MKILNKFFRRNLPSRATRELEKLNNYPKNTLGYTDILGKPFKFHDREGFIVTYKELFVQEIYKFEPKNKNGVILDCGANIGVSVLYFSLNYPQHRIIAFEPQNDLFVILQENVKSFGLKNVELHNKAIWSKSEKLQFYTDGGLGGRVNNPYSGQIPSVIDAVPLYQYLNEQIDMLKIDIEGAEDTVLKSCSGSLKKANHIFFEYHNSIDKPQTLHELLSLIKEEGFNYYIKESAIRERPFVDNLVICENFDMALNIFCYKTV